MITRKQARELLHDYERYLLAVEFARPYHSGVRLMEAAVSNLRKSIEEDDCDVFWYTHCFLVAQIHLRLDKDIQDVLRRARQAAAV